MRVQHVGDQMREFFCFQFLETARGHRRAADAYARCDERFLRIVRDCVLVHRDVRATQRCFGILAGDVFGLQIDQE